MAPFVLIMSVVAWDRLRERTGTRRRIVVVDRRTYRDAERAVQLLAAAGD